MSERCDIIQNYHKHTSFSNCFVSDCPASYEQYVSRAIELGHKVISSVEHGFQSNYYIPYELVEKHNDELKIKLQNCEISEEEYEAKKLKFIFGAEGYWVKDRKKEYPVRNKKTGEIETDKKTGETKLSKDMSNCHIILLAKNEEGRRDINEALSDANIDGYYKQPRLDIELLLKIKPENVLVTTACVFYWKYEDIEEITLQLFNHFGSNFYLEIQANDTELQKETNRRILRLSKEHGIDIIFGCDSHYIYPKDSQERDNYISTRRKNYSRDEDEETDWFMDYPDEQTVIERLKKQGVLNDDEIHRCINNTDILLEFDDLYFDKEIKLPSSDLSLTQDEKNKLFLDIVYGEWNKIKQTIPKSRHKEYEEGIFYESNAVVETGMADYFLIDKKIVERGIKKGGIVTKSGRGSGVSYYINSLLGFSNIDRFISPVKLYPDRFMSKTRILQTRSLPDLDLNLGNPEVFAEAQNEIMTEIYGDDGHAYPMISYKPLQKSSAFKLYAKSQNIDFDTANIITDQIKKYEKDLKNAETKEEKEALDLKDYVDKKYHRHLQESKKYQGIINAKSQAPCGYLIYGGNIKREIGLIRCVSESTKKSVVTTVIDGMVAENYKFVKNDLLKVDVWLTINKIFEKIGIPTYDVPKITELVSQDNKTWELYANGYTLGLNQCESDFGRQCCKRYKPKNMQELTALVAALRPGFKTQLQDFLDRKPYTTGVKELDDILKDSFHQIMYQENIMTYLGWLGIDQTETYAIIKKISKKKFKEKELLELKEKLIKGWISHTGTEEGFEKTWKIIDASAKYSFNASHAFSYAYDSVYGAYLKANYPYEFYSVMMQHLSEKGNKDKVMAYKQEMLKAFNIKEGEYKFRLDNREFVIDKENGCIKPSLISIKGISNVMAENLYALKDNKYNNFFDLLEDLSLKSVVGGENLITLIKMNYFSEFGEINYLLECNELFKKFYKNKKWGVQMAKSKAFDENIDFDILRKHSRKETVKAFLDVDMKSVFSEMISHIKFNKLSDIDIIKYRYEALEYVDIIDKKYTGYCVVTDISIDKNPKITLYPLANGNTFFMKIKKDIYKNKSLKRGDVIHVTEAYQDNKWRKLTEEEAIRRNIEYYKRIDKNWVRMFEKEWWGKDYKIC